MGCIFTKKTIKIYDSFMKIIKRKISAVKDQVKLKPDQITFNQTVLKSIIYWNNYFLRAPNTFFTCHRDDPQFYNSSLLEFSCINVGNYLQLIPFRVAAGDGILKRHIFKGPINAKYISKTIKNELICLCGEEIVTGIISEIKESILFSILADEVEDCSNTEQMSFAIRFVDNPCQIREEFISFLECESGTSGQELYLKIVNVIRDLGFEISSLRGQGYDRAGNMAEKKSGVSSRILKLNDKALYIHCFNHRFNLVIAKSCNIQKVQNVMGIFKEISYFFNHSPKRAQKKDVKKLFDADTTKENLIDLCLTP